MARVYTQKDIEEKSLQLRGMWLELKLRLTDWLAETVDNMPIGDDYKGVKCIVDSINQLEKLIGNTGQETNSTADMIQTADRTKSIIDRLES